jgi:succinate-acetate transporter protein
MSRPNAENHRITSDVYGPLFGFGILFVVVAVFILIIVIASLHLVAFLKFTSGSLVVLFLILLVSRLCRRP